MIKIKLSLLFIFSLFSFADLEPRDGYLMIRFIDQIDNEAALNKISQKYSIRWNEPLLQPRFIKTSNNFSISSNSLLFDSQNKLLRTYKIQYSESLDPLKFSYIIKNEFSEIEIAEAVYRAKKYSQEDFNDPNISSQYLLQTINAFEAWEIEDGDETIIIGISDDGLDQNHEDIIDNLFINGGEIPFNNVDDDNNGYIDDYNGYNLAHIEDNGRYGLTIARDNHGLKVAGIAGATPNNGKGIVGVGNKCKIFPLKISPFNDDANLLYQYESIIVAANLGFDILNMSWGGIKPYSPIEQSIVDYGVANGVMLISAAGNDGSFATEYPSGYDGVLGVGSCRSNDIVYSNNDYGPHNKILAPGQNAFTTDFSNGYTSGSAVSGSSFASPIVAGAAGIVKSKYPNLTPNQLIEFIRQMTDDVSSSNSTEGTYLPGRLNILKAVTTDPFTIPGIRLINSRKLNQQGNEYDRTFNGDLVDLELELHNYLGDYSDLKFTLSVANDPSVNSINIVESEAFLSSFNSNTNEKIKFQINNIRDTKQNLLLRLDISSGSYSDFLLLNYMPEESMYTFENDIMKISVGDDGKLGYSGFLWDQGEGIFHKEIGNQFRYGGLISFIEDQAHTANNGSASNNRSDYSVIDRLENDNSTLIMQNLNSDDIDFIIQKDVELSNSLPIARINIKFENPNELPVSSVGIGYVMDADVGGKGDVYLNNTTESPTGWIPEEFSGNAAAEFCFNEKDNVWYGISMFSNEPNSVGQAASYEFASFRLDELSDERIIELLSSGNSIQTGVTTDQIIMTGINFQNGIEAGEFAECGFCLSIASSRDELVYNLQNCILGNLNPTNISPQDEDLFISDDRINFGSNLGQSNLEIINYQGQVLLAEQMNINENSSYDLKFLNTGFYLIRITNKNQSFVVKFIKK